jgi:tripartite-type tricarboxylate transporter receptor subunit TctC
MNVARIAAVLTAVIVLSASGTAWAQSASGFEGKVVRIIVGLAVGGGFDTYARAVSRHMGKHIPGQPAIIVENMTGAGSLVSANHLYRVAKPDGLTIGHFTGSLLLGQVLAQPGIEFDARKFNFLGAPMREDIVCALTRASGITSVEKWMAAKAAVKLGGTGPGGPPDNAARIIQAALGLPVQLVRGYKGTSEIRLAAEAGELAGGCWSWESMRVTWRHALESGEVVPVLQLTARPFSDLPRVPTAPSLAKTDEARQLIEVGAVKTSAFARPFALPPGTPKERVELLRTAFQETLKDKAFLAEAEKVKLTVDPLSGEQLERLVAELFTLDPALVAKLKDILYK